MQVSEVMSKGIVSVNINESVKKVAELMKQKDVGALPILEDEKACGIVTDRDIVINCVASGYDLNQPISHAMTNKVVSIREDQEIEEATRLMEQNKVSRVVVVDKNERPVGMVSLQDLTMEDEDLSADAISKIKQ